MTTSHDPLLHNVTDALARSDAARLAQADQLSALWRTYFANRGLDLSDPIVAESALRALTMAYGLLMPAHLHTHEIDADSWDTVRIIMESSATAVVVARGPVAETTGH